MRRFRIALVAVGVALLSSGCWTQLGGDGTRRGYQPEPGGLTSANVASLAPLWSKTVPAGASSPVVYGGTTFVAGGNTVTAIDGVGGKLWQKIFEEDESGFSPDFGTPALLNDKIAVPVSIAGLGGMYSFDRANGDQSGSVEFHEFAPDPLAIGSGVVAITGGSFGSGGPVLYTISYNGKTGFVNAGDLSTPGPGAPMIAGNFVYVVAGSQLLAFNKNTCPSLPPPAESLPYCAPTWTLSLGSNGGMPVSLSAASVAVPMTNGTIAVVGAETGVLQWTATTGSTNAQAPAVSNSGVFYTGTADGRVRGFPVAGCGSATCSSVWSGNAGAAISSQPTVSGGVVYAGTTAGNVAAFTEGGCTGSPCTPVKSLAIATGPTTVVPVVNNGLLIAVASTGNVAAFKPN